MIIILFTQSVLLLHLFAQLYAWWLFATEVWLLLPLKNSFSLEQIVLPDRQLLMCAHVNSGRPIQTVCCSTIFLQSFWSFRSHNNPTVNTVIAVCSLLFRMTMFTCFHCYLKAHSYTDEVTPDKRLDYLSPVFTCIKSKSIHSRSWSSR